MKSMITASGLKATACRSCPACLETLCNCDRVAESTGSMSLLIMVFTRVNSAPLRMCKLIGSRLMVMAEAFLNAIYQVINLPAVCSMYAAAAPRLVQQVFGGPTRECKEARIPNHPSSTVRCPPWLKLCGDPHANFMSDVITLPLQVQKGSLQSEVEVWGEVERGFGRTGVQSFAIEGVLGELQVSFTLP